MKQVQERWMTEIRDSIRNIDDLSKHITLSDEEKQELPKIIQNFGMQITPYYLSLIDPEDPHDPLRRLVVPSLAEREETGWLDTSGEEENTKVQGLQHKYTTTVLLLPTPVCPTYCRYCFRKRFTTSTNLEAKKETRIDMEPAMDYLREHKEVQNVLITGGDPLTLSNRRLEFIISNLREMDHIKTIRLGTKFPAFNPFRLIDEGFLSLIRQYSSGERRIYIIAHFDHPYELTPVALDCLSQVMKAGAIVVNQTVFHKGINDDPGVLAQLFNRLSWAGIAPYYLFQLRPVRGSMRYRIPLKEGIAIFEEAKTMMSGLGKRLRYIMSHDTGKIEILGVEDGIGADASRLLLKYHQARDPSNLGKLFTVPLPEDACWLEDCVGLEGPPVISTLLDESSEELMEYPQSL